MLQGLNPQAGIKLGRTGTGVFQTYHGLYLAGHQLGPATSYEYQTVAFNGDPLVVQDFGSYRIEFKQGVGPTGVFGPIGQIPLP